MTPTSDQLALGAPRFRDPDLARCLEREGAIAAWRIALQRDARRAPAGVDGDFAVALRGDHGTFLAVDRFAIHTLCFRVDRGVLRFASRADELADANTGIDPQAIYDYLFFHTIPSPRTIYKGVHRLPPGHYASFDGSTLTVAPYWQPEFVEEGASFDSLRDEFRRLLREAVRRSLVGSRPACFLSGGTDSSTIAGLVGEVCGQPAATYSIGFDAEGYDEMEYARIAARHFKTDHHEYYVTPDDLVANIPKVAAHFDQPFGNSSALPAYLCQMRARDDGVTRILAGDGGDELFGGNERYAKQRVFGWYRNLPAASRSLLLEPLLLHSRLGRAPLLRKAASYIAQAKISLPERLEVYNLLRRIGQVEMLTPEFLSRVDSNAPEQQQRDVWIACPPTSELNRMLAYDWRYTLAENDLRKVCGTAALAGIDVGFPLLDEALLQFSMTLPTAYKLRGLTLRWFFKEALRGFLPDKIIGKRKHGFGLPFGIWLTRHAPLRLLAEDALRSLAGRGIVRSDFINTLCSTQLAAHPGYYGELVWILMMLELWLQRHEPAFDLAALAA